MKETLPKSIQELILSLREKLKDEPEIVDMFERCYSNTLDTTVKKMEDGSTYVITGDIPAMWLRDSVAQLRPYLVPAQNDPELADQFMCINIDPYANAFNEGPNGNCWEKDETDMGPWIWERKYEIDSLCYPLQFSYLFWKNTGRTDQFDEVFWEGVDKILTVFETEMNHEEKSPYSFIRKNCSYTDTLSRDGKGAQVKSGIGLIWSGFRPLPLRLPDPVQHVCGCCSELSERDRGFRRRERGNCKESRRDGKDRKTGHRDLRYHPYLGTWRYLCLRGRRLWTV